MNSFFVKSNYSGVVNWLRHVLALQQGRFLILNL